MTESLSFADEPYISLATFRKSGVEVPTPVWVAEYNGKGYVFSEGKAGKVKRLRNNKQVRVAKCDARGKVLGPWFDGTAEIVEDAAEIDAMYPAFTKKYGWQMRIADFFSKLSGRYGKRAIIAVSMD